MHIVSPAKNWEGLLPQSSINELFHAVSKGDTTKRRNETIVKNASEGIILLYGTAKQNRMAAAAVIGDHLKQEVYRIDVRTVISGIIGETENKLDAVFSQGVNEKAILFFDEADALFSERTDVKDSHDRYLNIELNYLLQKIEQYPNLVLLASDNREQVSPAYLKYFRAIIHLPPM